MKQLLAFLTIGLGLAYAQSTPAFGIFQGTDAVASSGHPCTGPQNVGSQYTQIASAGATYICQQTGDSSLGQGAFAWVQFVSSATASGGGSLVIASGKTFTVSKTLTLTGTDGTTETFPSTSATIARTDAGQTFTGVQVFSSKPTFSTGTILANANTITFPAADGTAALATGITCGSSATCASPSNFAAPWKYATGTVAMSTSTTVNVSGLSPAFASATSYSCSVSNANGHAYTSGVEITSSSAFTIVSGTSNSDTWIWACLGN